MNQKRYNKTNFHKHTFCEYKEEFIDEISNLTIHHRSRSGSSYSFNEVGVYRISNHWGRAANCRWRLISKSTSKINNNQLRIGFAKWIDFYPNNEVEKLFYIEVDFETNTVIFHHKDSPNYKGNLVLRNAKETAKVIRQIKDIFESNSWVNYYNIENVASARKKIIQYLVKTDLSLAEVKKKMLQNGGK